MTTLYFAIRKGTNELMEGQKGQAAFTDKAMLGRSLGYAHRLEARRKGVKTTELYSVHAVELSTLLPKGDE